MKIIAINGSPKGKQSNTNVIVQAFLKGAADAGAQTAALFLAEHEIKHCRGCHVCWTRGPMQCVLQDDTVKILSALGGADIIVFATPVYFENISGMLKVFMDRMTMLGSPHPQNTSKTERDAKQLEAMSPKLMMIANCGHPDRAEFQVLSHWMRRVALKMHMELIGEIYAAQGKYLSAPPEALKADVSDYLQLLEKAGKEIALQKKLSVAMQEQLEQNYIRSSECWIL